MTIGELKKKLERFMDDQEVFIRFALGSNTVTNYDLDLMILENEPKPDPKVIIHATLDTSKPLGQPGLEELYKVRVMGLWSNDAIVDGTWKDVKGVNTDGHIR